MQEKANSQESIRVISLNMTIYAEVIKRKKIVKFRQSNKMQWYETELKKWIKYEGYSFGPMRRFLKKSKNRQIHKNVLELLI